MATIRFYTDEHIARAVVKGLQQRGVDVLTCQQAGLLGEADKAHLQYAHEQGCVLVTQDTDFLILHNEGMRHSGIAYAPQGKSIGYLIQGLLLLGQVLSPEEMANNVEFL